MQFHALDHGMIILFMKSQRLCIILFVYNKDIMIFKINFNLINYFTSFGSN